MEYNVPVFEDVMLKLSDTLVVLPYVPNWNTELGRIRNYLMKIMEASNTIGRQDSEICFSKILRLRRNTAS